MKKKIALEDCFDFFVNFNNQRKNFFCKICHSQANYTTYNHRFMVLPDILFIIISKKTPLILNLEFPDTLDLSKYLEDFVTKKTYDLIGIISKSYQNQNIYYASILLDKQWYLYNNGTMIKCSISEAKNKGIPYILFYQKK